MLGSLAMSSEPCPGCFGEWCRLDPPCSLNAYDSYASLLGEQFEMIISNPAFPPTLDDSQHDVHAGEDALLGMEILDTIVRDLDAHFTSLGQPLIVIAAPGDDPLPSASAPPTPAVQPLSGNTQLRIHPLGLLFKMMTYLMFHPAAFVPC